MGSLRKNAEVWSNKFLLQQNWNQVLRFTPVDGWFRELLRLVQFSLVVIRSAKRYDQVKKKSDSAYDSVAYKVSSENYKVVTLVRRSDRSIFHNMKRCLGPSIAVGLFLSFSLHCKRWSRERSRKIKKRSDSCFGTPIPPFKPMNPFTTPSTTGPSPWFK